MSVQAVVAHYEEDLGWLAGKPDGVEVTVYHKGHVPFHLAEYPYCRLENVGREAHTYLYHICNYYGSLADVTLFCQGANDDHIPVERPVWDLLKLPALSLMAGPFSVGPLREWDQSGRMAHHGKWAQAALEGRMRMAPFSFVAWWKSVVGDDLTASPGLTYYPGSVFAVRKEAVLCRPRSFYEALLAQVASHTDPEEAYYLERAWAYLWKVPPDKQAAFVRRKL